ncbi:uncharacterized protein LOC143074964 isoform X2 [Mytilus galloprovincialis]|uniref:uncharacterized protein LOC143074964 isoform X2 n=1 Tax=Mytilus galloprovincialis TaxID=29158 RepID=UPI003F7C009C
MFMITLLTFFEVTIFVQGTSMMDIYVQEGDAVDLLCPMKISIDDLIWRGPPELMIYASGSTESNIKNVQVLHEKNTKENILKILKFAVDSVGIYQCISLRGGDDSFNITMLRKPNVSIVEELNPLDETLNLSCIASGGVPDNYTYEWEHRTDADHHIRFLSQKPLLTIRSNSMQSNGVYVCRVYNANSVGTRRKTYSQCAVYNLSISAVPHFVSNNTEELYVYLNQTTELKVYFIANPAANTVLLIDNKPAFEFNNSNLMKSVHKTTVVDYYHDKAVIVNGYEIKLLMYIQDRLDFSNITVVLQNDRGWCNYTIQLKTTEHTIQYQRNVGSKPLLVSLLTLSIFGVLAAVLGLKFAYGKLMTKRCKDDSTVPPNVTTHIGQLIPTPRPVFHNQSSNTDGISRMKGNSELNYIEVNFNQKSNQRRHVILRNDRTQYADVDLTIKADPLPDTDSEFDEDSTS